MKQTEQTKPEPDMRGNRFENDMILKWGRLALYKTDIGGLMAKVSGSIGSILFGLWSLEFDFRGKPTRGIGELVNEFGIGFTIGTDDRFPKCPDARVLFLKWSTLFRLTPPAELIDKTAFPLISRQSVVRFTDIDDSMDVMVDPVMEMEEYRSVITNRRTELYFLRVNIVSKVEVTDRSTGCIVRLSGITVPFFGDITSERIDQAIDRALIFHSKRLWIQKPITGIQTKFV